jgi:hypothetical protein
LVVDPPAVLKSVAAPKRKKAKKGKGGIDEWFVNTQIEAPSIDDS